ncbi:MAG: hypothetical protein QOK20_2726 [Acidimicrobiaceae bacterium]|nr:hypothetical protein [Acidimicrobiaceae bacterium]
MGVTPLSEGHTHLMPTAWCLLLDGAGYAMLSLKGRAPSVLANESGTG